MKRVLCILLFLWMGSALASGPDYDPWSQSAKYKIEYQVDLKALPKDKTVNLWVPLPVNNHDQRVLNTQRSPEPLSWEIRDVLDNRGNAVAEFILPVDPDRIETLHFSYVIERQPSVGLPLNLLRPKDEPDKYLSDSNMVPLKGLISSIASDQASKVNGDSDLARVYYDYVYDTMTYSKEGEGWGQGDAIWACQSRYGNCTDFHSLYIGLARSQGIPARFKIGFPLSASETSGRHDGYHCWAEVFNEEAGWLPLDASDAKKSNKRQAYFGKVPSDRVEFSQGRDLVLSSLQRGEPINYFIYPYAETNVEIIERLPVKFSYQRLTEGGR